MTNVKSPLELIICFIWLGFVCAISFMEAWIKFNAPRITISMGLSIGRLVFFALNKMEIIFAVLVFIIHIRNSSVLLELKNLPLLVSILILIIQTFWLLPTLDNRAELIIQGKHIHPSNLHFYYVGLEVVKVLCIFIFGVSLFNPIQNDE